MVWQHSGKMPGLIPVRVQLSSLPPWYFSNRGYLVAPKPKIQWDATLAVYAQAAACEATEMVGKNTGAKTGHRGASDHNLVSLGAY